MKSFEQLAQQQYECIRRTVNNFDGSPAPTWADLAPVEKAAWTESVRLLVSEVQSIH